MSGFQTSPLGTPDVMDASRQTTLRSAQLVMLCGTVVARARYENVDIQCWIISPTPELFYFARPLSDSLFQCIRF